MVKHAHAQKYIRARTHKHKWMMLSLSSGAYITLGLDTHSDRMPLLSSPAHITKNLSSRLISIWSNHQNDLDRIQSPNIQHAMLALFTHSADLSSFSSLKAWHHACQACWLALSLWQWMKVLHTPWTGHVFHLCRQDSHKNSPHNDQKGSPWNLFNKIVKLFQKGQEDPDSWRRVDKKLFGINSKLLEDKLPIHSSESKVNPTSLQKFWNNFRSSRASVSRFQNETEVPDQAKLPELGKFETCYTWPLREEQRQENPPKNIWWLHSWENLRILCSMFEKYPIRNCTENFMPMIIPDQYHRV